MLDVVSEAVHRLGRDQWWVSVHESLDHMADHEAAAYAADVATLDRAAGDNLDA